LVKKFDINVVKGLINIYSSNWEKMENRLLCNKVLFIMKNNKYLRSTNCTEDTSLAKI
jgi:hypothetical protein